MPNAPRRPPLELNRLQYLIVDALEDVKALDIQIFDVSKKTSLYDRVIIATGTSNRQTRALAKSVHDRVRAEDGAVLSIEGEETGEWVLVDCGIAVAHIFLPAIRDYYRLEEIWGGVELSIGDAVDAYRNPKPTAAVLEADDSKPKKRPARKRVVVDDLPEESAEKKPKTVKPAAKKPAAKRPSTRDKETKGSDAPAAKKPAARKPAAKKAASVASKPAAKKPAAKKAARPTKKAAGQSAD